MIRDPQGQPFLTSVELAARLCDAAERAEQGAAQAQREHARAESEAVKLSLSNIRLQESLREQAIRDPLTGLFNRRYLDETLPRELHLSRRRGEPLALALAMLDLDHFKHFNDGYGHEAGDSVLRSIGALLTGSLRTAPAGEKPGTPRLLFGNRRSGRLR